MNAVLANRPGRKARLFGFEDMEVGDWLNIRSEERHRYAVAIWRFCESNERMYVCREIYPGTVRIF